MKIWSNDIIDKNELILINHDESISCQPHSHEFYEIEYIYKGSVTQIINDVSYLGKKGDVFFMTPDDLHSFEKSQNYDSFNFLIHPDLVARFSSSGFTPNDLKTIKKKIHLSPMEMNRIENTLHNIESELFLKQLRYISIVQNLAFVVLTYLKRYSDSSVKEEEKSDCNLILQFIEDNYSSVTPKKISQNFFYNQNYLCKIFKQQTNLTMTAYINKIKINHAIQLLSSSNNSIENICNQVGISDKKYFYKLFRQQTGLTPNEYRLHRE